MKKLWTLKENLMLMLLLVPIFIFHFSGVVHADTWAKTYSSDIRSVQQTTDGGSVIAGINSYDLWVSKLDSNGNIQWQKTYGGSQGDGAYSTQQTTDGGYIVAGVTGSFGFGNTSVLSVK